MKKINPLLIPALCCALILFLQSCEWFTPAEDKTDPTDCYVPNSVMQDTFEVDGESLVWVHNDTITAHLIIYEILDDDINLSQQQSAAKQQPGMVKQQQNNPAPADRYAIVTTSDTFSLAEIPYTGAMNLYVYSMDAAGKIGSTPVVYARGACSIITTDVMMLVDPNCAASTEIRSAPALSPGKSLAVGWSSAPDSLYHCTITKGTAITSTFTIKLRKNPSSGLTEWSPATGCPSMNMPARFGSTYTLTDIASGLKYEVTASCTGFSIKNTGTAGSGKISVTVRKN